MLWFCWEPARESPPMTKVMQRGLICKGESGLKGPSWTCTSIYPKTKICLFYYFTTFTNFSDINSITDADGTQTVIIRPPYRHSFLVPVYADLQVNFSRGRSPFFGELKVGGAVQVDLERIRGTHNTNELELLGGGVLMGAAAGKRFALNNGDELSIFLDIDCILGPWYANVPVSLGFRYGF